MNAETIEAARQALRQRIAEANEAQAAFKAATTNKARRIAQDILQSRTLAVDQATAYCAACIMAERAIAAPGDFRALTHDMLVVADLHRRAKNLGALPVYLGPVCCNPEFAMVADLDPQATRVANRQADDFLKRLKRNPAAELV